MGGVSDPKDTQVVMQIPQDVIAAQVQAAVAGVLMERGDEFIAAMVRAAMEAPPKDRYAKRGQTAFGEMLEKSIQKAANEEAKVWIDEQKDAIKKAVRVHLGRTKKDVVAKIADQIIDQLGTPYVNLRISFGDDS